MAQPLTPIRLRELGQLGFFAEAEDLEGPLYASTLTNAQFDAKGRIAARLGYDPYLSSAIAAVDVTKLHYYAKEIGETEHWIAATSADKLYKLAGATGSGTATEITGAITTPSGSDWQFVNYNNLVVGMQQGDTPISWNGAGNFADYGSGTALPDGNCLLSAWGRLFGTTADGQSINWTATLGSDFDAVGSGQLNVRLVWPDGKDKIIGLASFNKRLVIFGQRSVLVYGDDAASQLDPGIDPNSTSFTLKETVEGVGLYARDAWAAVGNDLVFLSAEGTLRSMRRAVDYENLGLKSLSSNTDPYTIQETLTNAPAAADTSLVYDRPRGQLLLRLGAVYLYYDARRLYQDPNDASREPFYRAALWANLSWRGIAVGDDGNLRMGFDDGTIGEYGGYLDDTSTYTLDMSGTWMSLEDGQGRGERIKFLKRLLMFAATNKTYTVNVRWHWDFSVTATSRAITVVQASGPAEWGEAEWGEAEWSSGSDTGVYRGTVSGSGSGTFLKVGFSVAINDVEFAYQAINTQMKIGRLTR